MDPFEGRMNPEWTPKIEDVAKPCRNGHIIPKGRNGCLVGGCEFIDSEYKLTNPDNIMTEKPHEAPRNES